jgi:uncharacterized protein YdeI (YjbR/CyaY-like superfamily)
MSTAHKTSSEVAVLTFRTFTAWLAWLEKNHARSSGVWLKIAKKGSTVKSVSYDEALEAALSYGWIDAQKKGHDEARWLQKFVPRGARSIWSRINRENTQMLIESGRMKPAGLEAVERAKKDGQWEAAYDAQRGIKVPEDLVSELEQHPAAREFFKELNSINRYAILHRIQIAKKPETRAKRIRRFVDMLEKHEKIYP